VSKKLNEKTKKKDKKEVGLMFGLLVVGQTYVSRLVLYFFLLLLLFKEKD
jgi:hypothetical protein